MARPARKVEALPGVVNLLACLLLLLVAAGCARPVRSLPTRTLEPAWTTHLGSPARTGGGADVVLRDELEEEWRVEVGAGLTAPVVVARQFVLVGTGSRVIAVLDAETGDHFWERRLDGPVAGGVIHDRTGIYAVMDIGQGRAYALEVQRGQRRWARRVDGSSYAPLLVGDTLFISTSVNRVTAVRTTDGRDLWRTELARPPRSTPVPFDRYIAVAMAGDSLLLLSRATGRIERRTALPAPISAAPALQGDTLALPLESGVLLALLLPELRELWRADLGAPILAAPVAAPGGGWYALSRDAEVWRVHGRGEAERLAALGGAARGSLALARDRLVVGRLDGTLFLLDANGTIVWQRRFRDSIVAPATVAGGAVYVPLLRGDLVKLR